jgi:hypothetical protein
VYARGLIPVGDPRRAASRPRKTRVSSSTLRANVEEIEHAICEAVLERQRLRRRGASEHQVELNRLELVHLQQELSHALIARHCRVATGDERLRTASIAA